MKTKTSQSFPPEKSILQAINRIHYEVYFYLLQDNVQIVDNENEEVRPLWFTGMFLISCLHFHSNQQI